MFNKLIKGFDLSKIRSDGTVEATSLSTNVGEGYTGQLRGGMWVVDSSGKIAIIENLLGKYVDIMYVDPVEGTNVAATRVPASSITQARWSQIPEKRKPDQAAALSKGYFN